MKKLINLITMLSVLFGLAAAPAEAADMEYGEAVTGAYKITADMIFGINAGSVTSEWLADNLFTYDTAQSNDRLDKLTKSSSETYTIDLGENSGVVFGTYRTYISGAGITGGVTIYGSADDISFTELGKASQLNGGEWNDISLSHETAYRYIKVEPEIEAEEPQETEKPETETSGEDEKEEKSDSTSEMESNAAETDFKPAAAVKTVFIEAVPEADDETAVSVPRISGEVGASGALGFYGSRFPDCRGHWAEQIIIECTNKNYLDGYDDGTFHPDEPVTAAEFAKIFSAWQNKFYIVYDGHWAMPYIRNMLDSGVFENGDFADYGKPMSREECAKAIVKSLKAEYFPANLEQFEQYISDFNEVGEKYKEYVLKSFISGIITGYDDGSYNPKSYVTRAEILTLINRAINEDQRVIPEGVSSSDMGAAQTQTYYTAAVQVRKSKSANSMNFRLLGKNAQYMTEDDPESGLKLVEEFQGAQGMAFLMRFDLTDVIKRESELESMKLVINRNSNGDMPLGLFRYENVISDVDWNDSSYAQVINGSLVAGDNKAGYNAVCDNISALLPTWGDMENAVPNEEKTKPFAEAELEDNKYVFDLSLEELKSQMNDKNVVEFFATTVNYDRYGMEKDNKPRCYIAGELAPQIYSSFSTGSEGKITLTPKDAELIGGMLNLEDKGDYVNIANFTKNQSVVYNFKAPSAGKYRLSVNYSANQGSGGGTGTIKVNDAEKEHEFKQTGSWTTFTYEDLGEFELKSGENTLTISDKLIPNTFFINIIDIVFEKAE